MRLIAFILLSLSFAATVSLAAGQKPETDAAGPVVEPTRECNSCTARHQVLLRKKKLREQKAKSPEAPKPAGSNTTQ